MEDDTNLIIITIKHGNEAFQIDIDSESTVLDLKEKLTDYTSISIESQRLISNGRILKNDELVHGLNEATVRIIKLAENQITPPVTPSSKSNFSMDGMKELSKSLQPLIQQIFSASQGKGPQFQATTEDGIGGLLNPNSAEFQKVLEKNPEYEQIFSDPNIMKEMIEMIRNPKYKEQVMRDQDRAISNIEMLPEGFNTLRRAYSQVQEPMMNAVEESLRTKLTEKAYIDDSQNKLNKEPLPNPWQKPKSPKLGGINPMFPFLNVASSSSSSNNISPEVQYSEQLATLESMGFDNRQQNLEALIAVGGNVQLAIEKLLTRL